MCAQLTSKGGHRRPDEIESSARGPVGLFPLSYFPCADYPLGIPLPYPTLSFYVILHLVVKHPPPLRLR